MVKVLYKRVLGVVKQNFWKLLGLLWLSVLLADVAFVLGGVVLGIGLGAALLLSVGLWMSYLQIYNGKPVQVTQLFDFFSDWKTIKRVLCGLGWQILWISLWSAIPVVGFVFGTIRAYEYRLTPYILATEPDVSPTEAIKLSRERTMGYKGKMFAADLLLSVGVVLVMLVFALLCMIPGLGGFFAVLYVLAMIAILIALPVVSALLPAAFFEEIMNPTMNVSTALYAEQFCTRCGAPLGSGANFCPRCGNKIG